MEKQATGNAKKGKNDEFYTQFSDVKKSFPSTKWNTTM